MRVKEPLFQAISLKKHFPIYSGLFRRPVGSIKAVDGISFKIYPGEVLGIVGESGSGKSTAARSAIRLIEPTEGQLFFKGENFLEIDKEALKRARREIQIIFQDPYASLNPRKTVKESIGEALFYHNLVKTDKEQKEQVAEILKKIGLSPDVMERYPHQFSGGQQQRICIGRAIALNPSLIVCDEAVSALDVSIQAQILNLLIELKETMNFSYLFISHNLAVIHYISDYVAVMSQGKIVEEGSLEKIFYAPKHEYTKKLLSSIPPDHPQYGSNRNF